MTQPARADDRPKADPWMPRLSAEDFEAKRKAYVDGLEAKSAAADRKGMEMIEAFRPLTSLLAEMPRWRDRLVKDPAISETLLVVKGTNILVNDVVSSLFSDLLENEILERHPGLTVTDLRCCLEYAGEIDFPEPDPLPFLASVWQAPVTPDPEGPACESEDDAVTQRQVAIGAMTAEELDHAIFGFGY